MRIVALVGMALEVVVVNEAFGIVEAGRDACRWHPYQEP
jgi:hypothetical protein